MTDNKIENQNVESPKYQWDKRTEEKAEDLKKNVKTTNQLNESWKKLWNLRRETFVERKWNKIYYKIDAVNNYLKEISTSNKKIKEALLKDRKTIVTAIQIALYKSSSDYLPVWWIDWQRWPITRGAVAKFQNENWLEWQKNPWYLNVQTINKLIEVSTKKEAEKKQNQKPAQKTSTRKQINIPAPDKKIIEQPDKTRVSKSPIINGSEKVDIKKPFSQTKEIETEKKWWTIEELWRDITNKVWTFREWPDWDYWFAFKNTNNNGNWGLPEQITVCGETYKYNLEWNDLNWLWFETYDWWLAFQLWTYNNGTLEEWFRFYFDWVKEIGKFNYVWDLENGTRIDANWAEHKVENWADV